MPAAISMSEKNKLLQLLEGSNAGLQFADKATAEVFINDLFNFLFISSNTINTLQLENDYNRLKEELYELVHKTINKEEESVKHTNIFFNSLPAIYQQLAQDAEAVVQFDPAAHSISEVIIAYPGFFATAAYRLSHQLWLQGMQLLPRLFSAFAHAKTGIDIHPSARIGESFAIDHGTGIVIGETTDIGNHVKIYQGVTLGALNVDKAEASKKRHPTIEDDVVIYSNATILGGHTTIGKGSVIGGNVWLTHSVPSNSVVYHKSEVKIKDKNPFPEPVSYII